MAPLIALLMAPLIALLMAPLIAPLMAPLIAPLMVPLIAPLMAPPTSRRVGVSAAPSTHSRRESLQRKRVCCGWRAQRAT